MVVLAAACASVVSIVGAQQPASAPPPAPPAPPSQGAGAASQGGQVPVFRGGVDSVIVDVVVTDRTGRPITDLTKDDFEVREGGKPQTVDTFRLVQTDDGLDDATAQRDILSFEDQRRETARETNRLFVLFLDEYHVRRGNSMRVREEVAKFVLTLSPRDLVAVATPLSIMSGLTFSRNHDAVASIVRDFNGRKFDYTPMNALEARYQQMGPEAQEQMRNDLVLSGLRNLCEQLGSMRDGRKTILYVSEGMSGSLPSGVRTRGGYYGPQTINRGNDPNLQSRDFFEQTALINQMQQMFGAASRNNVAIYTLDPRGLANYEYGIEEDVSSADDRRILQESTDLLRVVAEETDGRAIVNSNDPLTSLRQMVRDSATYYLLGYQSSLAPRDGKFHEIDVRVKRSGVQVRARKGYWAYSAEDVARMTAPPKPAASAEVSEALEALSSSVEGARARTVRTWVAAVRGAGPQAVVTFVWEPATSGPTEPAETVDRLNITAHALSGAELFKGLVPRDTRVAGRGGTVTFEAPAGTVDIRMTAENSNGRRLDTDSTSLIVPDFTATGPMVSTPFVFRGRTARDLQQIRASEAPSPTIRRVFSRTERLLVRFGAYAPGGAQPRLTMRLLNPLGASLASLPDPVRAGDWFEGELVLGAFPPGDYVLEIAADHNAESARQFLAIRVTG
jgi:VWFA-related protein